MAWKNLLLLLISLAGIPAGLLISKYAKEELKQGKKWFKLIIILTAIIILLSFIFISDVNQKSEIMAVSGFIFMLALVSVRRG